MFNPRLPGRLQVKLLLLAFIAGLPALALLFWFGLDDREHALGRASEQLGGVARLAGLDQERRMEGVRHTVKLLSRVPELRGGSAKTCASLLNELRDRQSGFYDLGVFNADGSLRCSAMPLPVAVSVADRAWFRRAVDTRQLTISGYILSRLSGRHTLQFAAPLYDLSDQLNGVVFASWELTSHEKSLADLKLDAGTRLSLADPDGIVLGSYPANPAAMAGRPPVRQLSG